MRGPSLTDFIVMLRPGADPARVQQLVLAEIDRIRKEPVADWELEKIRMTDRRQHVERLYSTLSRAELLGEFAVFFNDPGLVNALLEKYNRVTRDDILRVARTYFDPNTRTVVVTLPKNQPPTPMKPGAGGD
jgi:zinc protease